MEGALVRKVEVSAVDKEQEAVFMLRSCLSVLGSDILGNLSQDVVQDDLNTLRMPLFCIFFLMSSLKRSQKFLSLPGQFD